MAFAERAVSACVRAMEKGTASEPLVQDILKCKKVDVTPIEQFITHPSMSVRWCAIRIIGEKGNINLLLKAAQSEEDNFNLAEILKQLGKRKADGIEILEQLLRSEDSRLKEAAIQMYRKADKTNPLFPLLFDESDTVVQRIKRYFDEQEREGRQEACT